MTGFYMGIVRLCEKQLAPNFLIVEMLYKSVVTKMLNYFIYASINVSFF